MYKSSLFTDLKSTRWYLTAWVLLITAWAQAQDTDTTDYSPTVYINHPRVGPDTTSRNAVYVEVGGVASYGSLNYTRDFFRKQRWAISGRVGMLLFPWTDYTGQLAPDITVLGGAAVRYGQRHQAELGVLPLWTNRAQAVAKPLTQPDRVHAIHLGFSAGYRTSLWRDRMLLRIAYTPVIQNFKQWKHFGGISAGYLF